MSANNRQAKKAKSERAKFQKREILLKTEDMRELAIRILQNAPIDELRPLLFALMEYEEQRRAGQLRLMWAGPLKDIATQVWVDGRTFSAEVWHEHFKRAFLPEEYDELLCLKRHINKETGGKEYRKWDYTPSGEYVLVGSTSDLTVKGFTQYLLQIESDEAVRAVQFSVNPNEVINYGR